MGYRAVGSECCFYGQVCCNASGGGRSSLKHSFGPRLLFFYTDDGTIGMPKMCLPALHCAQGKCQAVKSGRARAWRIVTRGSPALNPDSEGARSQRAILPGAPK
jgi:hypothetical protein